MQRRRNPRTDPQGPGKAAHALQVAFESGNAFTQGTYPVTQPGHPVSRDRIKVAQGQVQVTAGDRLNPARTAGC